MNAEQIIMKIEALKSERGTLDTHLQELADYLIPTKNNIQRTRVEGEKVQQHLLDNTGAQSLILLAGFLHGLLTNPNSQFFELTTGDEDLDNRDDVRIWLQKQSKKMLSVLNNSNFQTEIHELYIDLCGFGTSVMSIEEDDESIVRFATRPIKGCYIEEDNMGRVCGLYREFEWTAQQVVQQFGEGVLAKSKKLKDSFDKKQTDKFWIVHSVYKTYFDKSKQKAQALPYTSCYVLKADKVELSSGGFRTFPYIAPRWVKHAGEKYGRSPGMVALPEVKTVNLMVETTIKGAQKVVDPPLQAPDDGFIGAIRTRSGAINFYRAGTQDRITPIFNDARIDFGFQVIEDKRARIREAFFVDQLRLRQGDRMTTVEVEQRIEEGMRFMGPVLARQNSETLRGIIFRLWEIMDQKRMIDPAPDILKQRGIQQLDVQYSSLIARTQKQGEAKSILRAIEQASPFISADPSVLDWIDSAEAFKKIWRINNAPQEIIRSKQQVKAIVEARDAQKNIEIQEQLKTNTATNIGKVAPVLKTVSGG
jgi:hypothetical protein